MIYLKALGAELPPLTPRELLPAHSLSLSLFILKIITERKQVDCCSCP